MGRHRALLEKGILVAWVISLALGARYVFGQPQDFGADQYLEYTRYFLPLSALLSVSVVAVFRRHAPRIRPTVFAGLLALALVVGLGARTSLQPGLSAWWFALIASYAAAGVVVARLCRASKGTRLLLATAVLAVASAEAVLGILQFATGHTFGLTWLGEPQANDQTLGVAKLAVGNAKLLRPMGTFPHANVFGGFMVAGLLAYALANKLLSRSSRAVSMCGALVSLGLLVSFSRAAWLSAILALLSAFILGGRARWRSTALAVACLAAAAVFFIPLLSGRFAIAEQTEQLSLRVSLTNEALRVSAEHPLTGVGLRNFVPTLIDAHPDWHPFELQPVHNVPLLIAAELGIAGLVLCLLVLLALSPRPTAALVATLLVLLPIASLDHYLTTLPQGLGIAVLVILLLNTIGVPYGTPKVSNRSSTSS